MLVISADPKKKKVACRASYNASPEKKRVASRASYRADPEEKRAASRVASCASGLLTASWDGNVCEAYVIPFLFGSFFTVCHPYIDVHFLKCLFCYL